MTSKQTKRFALRPTMLVLALSACLLFTLGALGLAGCNNATDNSYNDQASSGTSDQDMEETITGKITSIDNPEILIEVPAENKEALEGSVRVDISQIDTSITKNLKVGDTVTVNFSGAVGTSEPPFISAITLEVATPAS